MLDIAWTELLIIAMVAILVVGPRELPRMLRAVGNFMGMVRRTAGDFQRQFNDALRETELDEVRRGFDSVRKANPLNKMKDDLNPLKQAGDSVRKAVEDPGAPKPSGSSGKDALAGKDPDAGSGSGSAETGAPAKSTGGNGAGVASKPKTTATSKPAGQRGAAASAGNPRVKQDKPKDPPAEKPRSSRAQSKPGVTKTGSGPAK